MDEYVDKNKPIKNLLITEEFLKTIDAKVNYESQIFSDPCQVI